MVELIIIDGPVIELLPDSRARTAEEILKSPHEALKRLEMLERLATLAKHYLNAEMENGDISRQAVLGFTDILQLVGDYETLIGEPLESNLK